MKVTQTQGTMIFRWDSSPFRFNDNDKTIAQERKKERRTRDFDFSGNATIVQRSLREPNESRIQRSPEAQQRSLTHNEE